MWETCRYCGSDARRLTVIAQGERACPRCAGSPLCDGCGHPRQSHTGVFASGGRTCNHVWLDLQSLTKVPCTCAGFAPVSAAFGDATFAQPDDDGFELRLA